MVGFFPARVSRTWPLIRAAGAFCVNILASEQEHLAQHFARGVPPIALWESVALRPSPGPPQLEGAAAWLRGHVAGEHLAGDHTFFVAEVDAAEPGPPGTRPLVFHGQAYLTL